MNSLLPIALPAVNSAPPMLKSAAPGGLAAAATGSADPQVNSFLSLLQQSSTSLANALGPDTAGDSSAETTPSDRALKNNKELNALLMNAASASVVPAGNQPLPFKFSLNIFGTPGDSKNVRPQKAAQTATPAASHDSFQKEAATVTPAATPLAITPTPLPVTPAVPAPANLTADPAATTDSAPASAAGSNVPAPSIEAPAERSNNPRLNLDTDANGNAAPSELAFALRLQPTGPVEAASSDAAAPSPNPATNGTAGQTFAGALPDANTATLTASPAFFTNRAGGQQTVAAPIDTRTSADGTSVDTTRPGLVAHSTSGQQPATAQLIQRPSVAGTRPEPVAPGVAQQPTPFVAQARQNPAGEQPSLPANKPNETNPAPANHLQTQSQADQHSNVNSGTDTKNQDNKSQDNKSEDGNGENRHAATNSTTANVEPAASPNPVPSEVAHVSMPALNTQSAAYSPAASSVASSAAPPAPSTAAPVQTQATPLTPANDETVKTGTANQISFSVPAGDNQKVEVRLMDRAGEVRVSVRAPNEELAGTLRQDLGSLTGKLNQSGYTTEAFTPSRGSGESPRDQKNADQQQPGGERQSSGRNPQQQSPQQEGRGKRPAWLDELDNSMATAPTRKDKN